jgi:hypothetical protein
MPEQNRLLPRGPGALGSGRAGRHHPKEDDALPGSRVLPGEGVRDHRLPEVRILPIIRRVGKVVP